MLDTLIITNFLLFGLFLSISAIMLIFALIYGFKGNKDSIALFASLVCLTLVFFMNFRLLDDARLKDNYYISITDKSKQYENYKLKNQLYDQGVTDVTFEWDEVEKP